MQRISKTDAASSSQCVDLLRQGTVIILPTDTMYGFSSLAVPDTAARMQAIKGREEAKPFIRLIAAPDDIYRYTTLRIPPPLFDLWPAPLTLVVPLNSVAGSINSAAGSPQLVSTAAFRCPADAWLRAVIQAAGAPIYSTSVNRSGQPPLSRVADITAEFAADVPLIVDAGDFPPAAAASTLVAVTESGWTVLRQGAVRVPEPSTACKNRPTLL